MTVQNSDIQFSRFLCICLPILRNLGLRKYFGYDFGKTGAFRSSSNVPAFNESVVKAFSDIHDLSVKPGLAYETYRFTNRKELVEPPRSRQEDPSGQEEGERVFLVLASHFKAPLKAPSLDILLRRVQWAIPALRSNLP